MTNAFLYSKKNNNETNNLWTYKSCPAYISSGVVDFLVTAALTSEPKLVCILDYNHRSLNNLPLFCSVFLHIQKTTAATAIGTPSSTKMKTTTLLATRLAENSTIGHKNWIITKSVLDYLIPYQLYSVAYTFLMC